MRTNVILFHFLLMLSLFTYLLNSLLFSSTFNDKILADDSYIHALASLVFYTREWKKSLTVSELSEDEIIFSNEEVANLWNSISRGPSSYSSHIDFIQSLSLFHFAYQYYEQAGHCVQRGKLGDAQNCLHTSLQALTQLWEEAIEREEDTSSKFSHFLVMRTKKDPNFDNNPYLSLKIRQAMEPYLLPLRHSMRCVLDSLCLKQRVTLDKETFYKAGFRTIAKGPRSYICVAKHQKMPGYLVKAYLDTELKAKFNKESWQWLVRRCEGASKIRNIIRKRNIRFFVVADKWIYCLPPEPSPLNDNSHIRHLALLLVTDMHLASTERNYQAWSRSITKGHLDELFEIISRAKGASYRPDNIAYTKNQQFAFIDTEYPTWGPDFKSIRQYLNREMRAYWDRLVKHGGYQTHFSH